MMLGAIAFVVLLGLFIAAAIVLGPFGASYLITERRGKHQPNGREW